MAPPDAERFHNKPREIHDNDRGVPSSKITSSARSSIPGSQRPDSFDKPSKGDDRHSWGISPLLPWHKIQRKAPPPPPMTERYIQERQYRDGRPKGERDEYPNGPRGMAEFLRELDKVLPGTSESVDKAGIATTLPLEEFFIDQDRETEALSRKRDVDGPSTYYTKRFVQQDFDITNI